MNPTQVNDSQVEQSAQHAHARTYRLRTKTILIARIAAGVMTLPFLATFITGTRGALSLVLLLLAVCGAWLLLHVQRRAGTRPSAVLVDADGLIVERPGRRQTLAWREIGVMHTDLLRGSVSFGTRVRPEAITFDADLDDLRGFLDTAARLLAASRSGETAAPSGDGPSRDVAARTGDIATRGDDRAAHGREATHGREAAAAAHTHQTLFQRSLRADLALYVILAAGIVPGLIVRPAWFVVAALALPVLVWRWLATPHSVVIDGTAVWVVRPLARDVIPLRAVRAAGITVFGWLPGPAVTIEHRDRGTIVIRGLNAAALPLLDAITAALERDRAAQRAAAPPAMRHTGAASQVAGSRQSALLTTAAAALGLIGIVWLTVFTGVPLRTATQVGSGTVARAVLLLGAPLESADGDGLTALHHAGIGNETGIARALLNRGAATTARSSLGATPLHAAAERGHDAVAELFVAAGADVNARSRAGHTPLAHAARAPAAGGAAVARLLLDAGADPNIADEEGRTAAHHAALAGGVDLIRQLARAGANLDMPDLTGQRPLHLAVIRKQQAAVGALLDAGADVNARGADGRTAIGHAAVEGAAPALVTLLLDAGARAGTPADDGWNAIQLATRANNIEMLELFARRRAPLDATDGRVAPALWLAAESGSIDAVRALLRGGANPRLRWRGRSPIELARAMNSGTMIALMQMR